MIRLALSSLRFRLAASAATFVAVLLGAAILIACGGLFETAIQLDAAPQRLAGAPVVVTAQAGFPLPDEESEEVPYAERTRLPADVVDQIAGVDGVRQALPDVSFPAVLPGPGDPAEGGAPTLTGHGWSSAALTPYRLRAGAEPLAAGQVVVDAATAARAGVKPGERLAVVVRGSTRTFTVTGVAAPRREVQTPALFFSAVDTEAFAARSGLVDAVGVLPAPGVDPEVLAQRLESTLPAELMVRTGDDRGAAEFTGVDGAQLPLILLAAVFGAMVIVVLALVVSATITLSVRQRQRELALLRAGGATPAQVRRLVVVETMAVAGAGVLGGVLLGGPVGDAIFAATQSGGVLPSALEFRQGVIPFAAGALIALGAAWLTVRIAARAAERTRPIQALADAAIPPAEVGRTRRRLAAGFAGITVALGMSTMFLDRELASAVGGPATLTGSIAVALIGPELVRFLVDRIAAVVRRTGEGSELAVINTRARAVQFAAVLTPITLATAIALGNIYSQTTLDEAALDAHVDQFAADAVVDSTAGGVSPGLLEQVRSTPGVSAASAVVMSRGWLERPYDGKGSDPGPLLGVSASGSAVVAVPVVAGSLRELTGNAVALPAESGVDLGDQVTVRLGDGARADVTVVALLGSSDADAVVLPVELLAPHTTSGLPSQVLLRGSGDLVDALEQELSGRPGVFVGDDGLLADGFAAQLDIQAWINYLLAGLAIAYAAIASVNTLAVAVLSRRREFAVQRLAGATRGQVHRMLRIEGGLIAVLGIALGTLIAAFTVVPTAFAVGSVLPSGPLWVYPAVLAAVGAIVWPVTVLVGRMAMAGRPVDVVDAPG